MSRQSIGHVERGWKLQLIAVGDPLTVGGWVREYQPKPKGRRRTTSRGLGVTPAGLQHTGEVVEIKERK